MGKSRTLRRCEELHLVFEATRFYATQWVSLHNTMPLQEVWKKWHNREAELFYELARKYKTEAVATSALMHWQQFALTFVDSQYILEIYGGMCGRNRESGCHEVEMRLHSEVDLDRLRDINKHESQQTEAKLEPEAHRFVVSQVLNMSSTTTMFMGLFVGV